MEIELKRADPSKYAHLLKKAPKFVDAKPETLMDESKSMDIYVERVCGKLLVLSKSEASKFEFAKPWACISIGAENGDWPKINKVQQVDLLQLAFYDTEFKRESEITFNEEHANKVLDFMDRNWNKVELIMVHCLAGRSRSPGVAAAISRIKYGSDDFWFHNYLPNSLVYRTILNVAQKRGIQLASRGSMALHQELS
jgi:predicted protein tyrosine phosphatase